MADEDENELRMFFEDLAIALAASFRDLPIQDVFAIQVACLRLRFGKTDAGLVVLQATDGTPYKMNIEPEVARAMESLKDAPKVVLTLHGMASVIALKDRGVNVILVGRAKEPEPPKEVVH